MTDIAKLLEPVAQDAPCGPNLEYDPEFLALEQAAQGKPEQVLGNNIVPAEDPDWTDLVRRAEALLARTKDLRVAVVYTRARTRRDQLPGLADGLGLIAKLLGDYWDVVHPQLDPDEADDATTRLNALAALGSADGLLVDVRAAQVVRPGPYGRLSVRDLLLATGKLRPMGGDAAPNETEVSGVLNAVPKEDWDTLAAAGEALGHLKTLEHVLVEKVGAAQATDLKPLGDTLRTVAQACAAVTGAAEPGEGGEGAGVAAGQLVLTGEVRTREEALRLLDRVCAYMERTEPANPAPLLIRRAQRLMAMNFVQIIEDLAPDAIGQVRTVAGIRGE